MINPEYLFIALPPGAGVLLLFSLAVLIIFCFYLYTLQNTLLSVSEENRLMPPGKVWMLLIPLFNFYWHFVVVGRMADSIKAEAVSRNIEIREDRPGYNIGVGMCIFNCISAIPKMGPYIAMVGFFCWIFYWVRIASYKSLLNQSVTY